MQKQRSCTDLADLEHVGTFPYRYKMKRERKSRKFDLAKTLNRAHQQRFC